MRRLDFLDSAKDNISDIEDYVSAVAGHDDVGRALAGKIVAKCQHLASLPGLLGRARPELEDGLRCIPLGNYLIFFRYRPDTFEVVNVLHSSRDILALFKDGAEDKDA